jgi:hypothetical protein
VAVDLAGNIIIGDNNTDTIYRMTPDGLTITAIGSAGVSPSVLQDIKIAVNGTTGDIIVANDDEGGVSNTSAIRRITPGGSSSVVYSGGAIPTVGGLTIDLAGNYIVASFGAGNGTLFKVTPAGVVSTLVGPAASLDGALTGLAIDFTGNFIATVNGGSVPPSRILKITPAGVITTVLGGSPITYANDVKIFTSPLSTNISIAPTSLTLNSPYSSITISGTVTNHTSQDQHLVFLQSWITQGTITIAAGGAIMGSTGVVTASSTQALGSDHTANAGLGSGAGMTPGPATLTVELRQSVGGTDVVWDSKAFPITLTP